MKKKIIIVVLVVLAVAIAWGTKYMIDLAYYENAMSAVTIQDIDFEEVEDGVYEGTLDARIISATTRVSVSGGEVTSIELIKHKYERGGAAVSIIDDVIKNQSLQVDAVSGATNSSKAILKSIENALNNNME